MHIILALVSFIPAILGFITIGSAESAIHEILSVLLFLIGAILFSSACIVEAVRGARREGEKCNAKLDKMIKKISSASICPRDTNT